MTYYQTRKVSELKDLFKITNREAGQLIKDFFEGHIMICLVTHTTIAIGESMCFVQHAASVTDTNPNGVRLVKAAQAHKVCDLNFQVIDDLAELAQLYPFRTAIQKNNRRPLAPSIKSRKKSPHRQAAGRQELAPGMTQARKVR